jgi:Dual specificity phosphatase, catalytic domain
LSSPEDPPRLGLLHRGFDRLYPAIRFTYERLLGHIWFSRVTPTLWLGGAPTYGRDFDELLRLGITAVVDMRAERAADATFFDRHDIAHRQYRVPDVTVPDEDVLTDAVDWISARILEGRVVLIHCAKGRGRSATVLAAYLMDAEGMTFDEVDDLLTVRRPLVKLQDRHRQVLESWIARRREPRPGGGADSTSQTGD